MIKEGDEFITVGRDGQKCANFKSGGCSFSMPVWVAKRYVAKRNYKGELKYFFVESFGRSISGRDPSQKFVDEVKSSYPNFKDWIRHATMVVQPPTVASIVIQQALES